MKLYQLFHIRNEWYAAAIGGFSGLIAATIFNWASVSASLAVEATLFGMLTMIVGIVTIIGLNLVVRLWAGRWPVDA